MSYYANDVDITQMLQRLAPLIGGDGLLLQTTPIPVIEGNIYPCYSVQHWPGRRFFWFKLGKAQPTYRLSVGGESLKLYNDSANREVEVVLEFVNQEPFGRETSVVMSLRYIPGGCRAKMPYVGATYGGLMKENFGVGFVVRQPVSLKPGVLFGCHVPRGYSDCNVTVKWRGERPFVWDPEHPFVKGVESCSEARFESVGVVIHDNTESEIIPP
jgi:hypothetical protein